MTSAGSLFPNKVTYWDGEGQASNIPFLGDTVQPVTNGKRKCKIFVLVQRRISQCCGIVAPQNLAIFPGSLIREVRMNGPVYIEGSVTLEWGGGVKEYFPGLEQNTFETEISLKEK